MSCKQHHYQHFLLSVIPNILRQCTWCNRLQSQVTSLETGELIWVDTTMADLFGDKIYIVTGDRYSFDASKAYLAEDYNLPEERFAPLLTQEDWAGFKQICDDGGRPCMIMNPTNWFENPFIGEWDFAASISSNIGGVLLRPIKEGYV